MANLDAAFGLNPVGNISGGANQKLNEYKIASNEANAIFPVSYTHLRAHET